VQPASCDTRVGDSTFLSKACPATVSEAACSSQDIPAEAEDNLVVVPKPITDANSELQITLCQINVANVDPSLDTTPVIVPPETDAHLEMKRMRFSDRLCFFLCPGSCTLPYSCILQSTAPTVHEEKGAKPDPAYVLGVKACYTNCAGVELGFGCKFLWVHSEYGNARRFFMEAWALSP